MGYDLSRFNTQIDDEFLCVICTMVLENPVQSPQCEHSFCEHCIKEWLLIKRNCPVDRNRLKCDDLKPIARSLRNILNKLEIKCDFESKGCTTTIKLENLQNHVNQCMFNPNLEVTCNKGCGLKIINKEYDNHNCISHLANLVIQHHQQQQQQQQQQQKQISRLNTMVAILKKGQQKSDSIGVIEQNIYIYKPDTDAGTDDTDTDTDTDDTDTENAPGIVKSNEPLNPEYSYFEIEILKLSGKRISIGLTCKKYPFNIHPGRDIGSIGYYGDGKIYIESEDGVNFGSRWKRGDIIGCGVKFPPDFTSNQNTPVLVYFTRNNVLIGEKSIGEPKGGFFPTIGIEEISAKVFVDLFPDNL